MNKVNYQLLLEKEIKSFNGAVPKLLLHVCCAPCSSYCLEYLSEFFEITVFFYNPNIEPEREYLFRRDEELRFIKEINVQHPIHFVEGKYNPVEFHHAVHGLQLEKEGGARCTECFNLRLNEAALYCKTAGFDYFTTTLTISPLKDANRLNQIGLSAAEKYGIKWLSSDFKKKGGYLRSIELSREHHLYRQNYCGCVYSKLQCEERERNKNLE